VLVSLNKTTSGAFPCVGSAVKLAASGVVAALTGATKITNIINEANIFLIFIFRFSNLVLLKIFLKNPHEILRITCPKDESPFLTFFVILLHHYLRTGRLSSIWFSETVEKLISELPSKAQM
jgi:hypothetical protein